jgi:hypothetical protein
MALIATIGRRGSRISCASIVREKAPSPAIETGKYRCASRGGSVVNGRGSGVVPGVKIESTISQLTYARYLLL